MDLTLKIAKVLVQLINGETIPDSSAKSKLIDDLVRENIIFRKGKHKKTLQLFNENNLHLYLINQLQINNLNKYIQALENDNSTRADFVKITSDSKNSKERVFKGFLINCYNPIIAELNNQTVTINPTLGSFIFIYDYETFKIPKNVTIIGVENTKNFSQIQEQKYLFEGLNPLFVSRYPQNQNKDLIKWLKSVPNNYLHFGDFDFAGIGIYLNEYKKHLSQKATFFIPENIKSALCENGNRERFNNQKLNFKIDTIQEVKILYLLEIINTEKKGLDQEYYIETETQ
ncbi:DUF7281 domain-containing protein [Flavobacterium xanthum]|jgi:hypothetical protein|uniref:DUF7281 domain-containing protein n=1 Tax=Flavobacterium xanthum TaxID=69322 RepID=A0A1M7LD18_9FLAO|nr:hypothetical protein [Flavobacterium xanthum]SHM76014.1 hypothetical protein SAMN05443669_10691 [Flavobacterium xanthum]